MPVAAAIVGSSVVGAGTAVYGAGEAKKANAKATAAATAANERNIAAARENRDYIANLNQPKIAGGNAAFDMLLKEFGVGQPAPQRQSSYRSPSYSPQGGQPATSARPVGTTPIGPSPYTPPSNAGGVSRDPAGGYAPTNPGTLDPMTAFNNVRSASNGGMLGSGGPGWTPPAPGTRDGPPGPAPAGQKWVHGPEGYILAADAPSRPMGNVISDLGAGFGGGARKAPNGRTVVGYGPTDMPIYAHSGGPDAAYNNMPAPGTYSADTFNPNDSGYAGGVPAQPQGGNGAGFDTGAYLNNNPDVAAEFERLNSTPEGQATLQANGVTSPDDYAARHYETSGQAEGRVTTPYAPEPAGPAGPPDLINAQRPEFGDAPTYQRGQDIAMQDYGQAPDAASYYANFEADPGAAYRRSEALSGVNAASAARGKLRSGDAAKALATLSSDLGSQEYGNWFARQTQRLAADRGQFNSNRSFAGNLYSEQNNRADQRFGDDRSYGSNLWDLNRRRSDTNFNTDRTFQTNERDNRVNNLFRVSGIGDNAIGNVTSAGNNFTNAATNNNINGANIASNSAWANGQANTNLVNGIGSAISDGIGALAGASFGGGGGAARTSANTIGYPRGIF